MSKPFDASLKDLIERYPADWVAFLGHAATKVEVVDADVSTVSGAADKIVRVEEAIPWLLHVELQTSYDTGFPDRMQWYNTLVAYRHGLSVRSVAVLLRRQADGPALTGQFQRQFAGEPAYLDFRYQVVRLWQIPVTAILGGGLGLLPLAPLADVDPKTLPDVIHSIDERVKDRAEASQLWATTFVLMGLRYPEELAVQLFREVRNMEESVTYQLILNRGRAKGKAEGRAEGKAEGRAEEARSILLRQGEDRFGAPDDSIRDLIGTITDLERLERLTLRLLHVENWQDLLSDR